MSSNPPIVNNFIRQIIHGDQETGKAAAPMAKIDRTPCVHACNQFAHAGCQNIMDQCTGPDADGLLHQLAPG